MHSNNENPKSDLDLNPLRIPVSTLSEAIADCRIDRTIENAAKVCLRSREVWFSFYCELLASSKNAVEPYREPLGKALEESTKLLEKMEEEGQYSGFAAEQLEKYCSNVKFRQEMFVKLYDEGIEQVVSAIAAK